MMTTKVRHTIYWLMIYILWTFMKSSGGNEIGQFLKINLVNVPIYMAAYYFLKHVQIPTLYNKRKLLLFFLSILASGFVLYTIWRIAGVLWIDALCGYDKSFMKFDRYLVHLVQFYSPAVLLLAWEIQEDRQKETQRLVELEKEKISTELKYLKAQLNPHFLFNSFNNLYSLVITEDPKAPQMVLQLSAILDYILYKSQKDEVTIAEEIQVVKEYIALEQIRYGDKLDVELEVDGDTGRLISPLIILTLVENAFKHGASTDIDNPRIKIEVNATSTNVFCHIWNTKSLYKGESKDPHKNGIGLKNVKRQLALRYPEQHSIEIQETEKAYSVKLTLSHV